MGFARLATITPGAMGYRDAKWKESPDFCVKFDSKITVSCIYSQHNCIYTQGRDESVNDQAARGV
ncbi:hypothetical protein EFT36_01475 [Raoultella ornithinolytica]|nr:hypothetical protein EFT36_01475 [Raoultella ornithinolytica]